MGAALAERRRDRAAGSQLEARAPARHASGAHRRDRTVASAADELAGDRKATRHAERDGDKSLAPARPQSPQGDRPASASPALPTGAPGRATAPRHEETAPARAFLPHARAKKLPRAAECLVYSLTSCGVKNA